MIKNWYRRQSGKAAQKTLFTAGATADTNIMINGLQECFRGWQTMTLEGLTHGTLTATEKQASDTRKRQSSLPGMKTSLLLRLKASCITDPQESHFWLQRSFLQQGHYD